MVDCPSCGRSWTVARRIERTVVNRKKQIQELQIPVPPNTCGYCEAVVIRIAAKYEASGEDAMLLFLTTRLRWIGRRDARLANYEQNRRAAGIRSRDEYVKFKRANPKPPPWERLGITRDEYRRQRAEAKGPEYLEMVRLRRAADTRRYHLAKKALNPKKTRKCLGCDHPARAHGYMCEPCYAAGRQRSAEKFERLKGQYYLAGKPKKAAKAAANKAMGLCPCGRPPIPGAKSCEKCRSNIRAFTSKHRDKLRERGRQQYREARANGLCVKCKTPSAKVRCEKCAAAFRADARRRRAKPENREAFLARCSDIRRANQARGFCRCGRHKPVEGLKTCDECLQAKRLRRQRKPCVVDGPVSPPL